MVPLVASNTSENAGESVAEILPPPSVQIIESFTSSTNNDDEPSDSDIMPPPSVLIIEPPTPITSDQVDEYEEIPSPPSVQVIESLTQSASDHAAGSSVCAEELSGLDLPPPSVQIIEPATPTACDMHDEGSFGSISSPSGDVSESLQTLAN